MYDTTIIVFKTWPCQISATTNVMNHLCMQYALFACSNEQIFGRVSGVVVDEGGYSVCLPSVA